jgi:hypothetical protein
VNVLSSFSHGPKLNIKHSLRSDIQAFMASSEDTSLLSTENNSGHDRLHDVHLRFSSTRKNIILAMVSGCIVLHCMFTFLPVNWPVVPHLIDE